MTILTLDMGKDKSVGCTFVAETGEHAFMSLRTCPSEVAGCIEQIHPDRVVIEIGPLAGWVADLVRGMGIELQVANPNHEAWRWRKVKAKTDRLDALKLARLSAMNQLPLVHVPPVAERQWRALIAYRQALVARRTRIKNRIRALLEAQGLKGLRDGQSAWSQESLAALKLLAQALAEVPIEELWKGILWTELAELEAVAGHMATIEARLDALGRADERVQRLQQIPGVGKRMAETVVAFIGDPHRFKSGKQVGCYAGLTPRPFNSGKQNRSGGISGEGNRHLRSMLIEVSWLALHLNPWLRELYERIRRGSSVRKKIAIVAVARRLLVRCWAMLRDGTDWQQPQPTNQAA
jgi:transposase